MTIADLANLPPTLTVPDAAKVLGVSRGVAYAMARTGELPVIHCGRREVVPTARLLALLGVDPPSVSA